MLRRLGSRTYRQYKSSDSKFKSFNFPLILGELLTIRVIKANGRVEEFQPRKIRRTLLRAGVGKETSRKIIEKIEGIIYDGITTEEILKRVKALIPKQEIQAAIRYDLKAAITRLGPTGFPFETFVAEILEHYGYRTKLRTFVKGRCVRHEIDVIAERTNGALKRCMVECKFHNQLGGYIDLKDVLYTYARFLDLNEGSVIGKGNRFDEAWMISNTRASPEAKRYASCRGLKLLCWRYPTSGGLEKMIEEKKLYPVTILPSVDKDTLDKLFTANIMLAKDFVTHDASYMDKTGLTKEKLEKLVSEAKQLFSKPLTKPY